MSPGAVLLAHDAGLELGVRAVWRHEVRGAHIDRRVRFHEPLVVVTLDRVAHHHILGRGEAAAGELLDGSKRHEVRPLGDRARPRAKEVTRQQVDAPSVHGRATERLEHLPHRICGVDKRRSVLENDARGQLPAAVIQSVVLERSWRSFWAKRSERGRKK